MKIGIESHTIEKEEKLGAGGNYLSSLLNYWQYLTPEKYQFFLYFKDEIPQDEILNAPVFKKRIAKNVLGIKSLSIFYNFSLGCLSAKDKNDILFLPFYMQPLFCKTPTVVTIHDISFFVHKEWFSWRYLAPFYILTGRAIKQSKSIIVPSQFSKNEILKYFKIPESKIFVTHLGADEAFRSKEGAGAIEETKRKYGINKKYFFYAGSIFNRRHLAESIKAFKILRKDFNDIQFLISGRDLTHPPQKIDNLCEEVNKIFPGAIIRRGYIEKEDLKVLFKGCELFVWPSEYEGFGLPVLEAMTSGAPVLTTNKTSLAEVVGQAAFFVDNPSDAGEIKEAMTKALNKKELREEIIQKGLEQSNKFSWHKCAKETIEIIEKAI